MGVSIGGWTAANYAVRRPGRAASLALLDPVDDLRADPAQGDVGVRGTVPVPVPEPLRRSVFSWIAGGADVDDSVPEAA